MKALISAELRHKLLWHLGLFSYGIISIGVIYHTDVWLKNNGLRTAAPQSIYDFSELSAVDFLPTALFII